MNKKIRIAVVGLGWVAQNRHIPAILKNKSFELIGLVDKNEQKASEICKKYSLTNYAGDRDLNSIDWMKNVDAITIATPPSEHARIAVAAAGMGKHVLTEKPLAMSKDEAQTMKMAAQDNKTILAIVHNFQFSKSFLRLKEDMQQGRLGDLHSIHARQFGNPGRRLPSWYETLPFGLFFDESPHLFYLIRALSPTTLRLLMSTAYPGAGGMNTPAQMSIKYESFSEGRRIPVTVDLDFESALSEWHVMVTGSKGMAIVDIFRDIYIYLPNDGIHGAKEVIRTSLYATIAHWSQHFTSGIQHLAGNLDYGNNEVFLRFSNAINNGSLPDGISAEDALAVHAMQVQAIESCKFI